jgi:hypothetical protein
MSNTSKKVSSKSSISKTSNKKPVAKKAAYVSRKEYKAKFERQMSLAIKNAARLTVVSETNNQLNKTLTEEIKKVVEARKEYSRIITKYDLLVLSFNDSKNINLDLESIIQESSMKISKFENLSTFRKLIIVLTDSVSNFIK